MIIAEIIERADTLRPNPFAAEEKIRWLSELDGKIAVDVFDDEEFSGYDISDSESRELILEDRYSDVYLFYLCAMIDFFSRDYGEYNNSIALFNSAYEKMAKTKHRKKIGGGKGDYYKNIF